MRCLGIKRKGAPCLDNEVADLKFSILRQRTYYRYHGHYKLCISGRLILFHSFGFGSISDQQPHSQPEVCFGGRSPSAGVPRTPRQRGSTPTPELYAAEETNEGRL